jgi:hypothetical protein
MLFHLHRVDNNSTFPATTRTSAIPSSTTTTLD